MTARRYRLLEALGSGGQADVWRVDDGVARRVLKAVRGTAARGELAHEFERLSRLDHPALPRVRDLGVLDEPLGPLPAGTLYFTADEIDGVPLDVAMAAAPAAERPRLLWSAAIDVASALAHVHAAGLCHCDVTPANVLVTGAGERARAVLIDLGLSAVRGVLGEARGTLAYMAPEALAGVVSARADLWGLGATLFHAATGIAPFAAPPSGRRAGADVRTAAASSAGGSATTAAPASTAHRDERAEIVRAILTTTPPRLDAARAPGLADLIARLLARDPAARPASALAVFDELAVAAAALPQPPTPRPRPSVRAPLTAPTTLGAGPALAELDRALEACRAGAAVDALALCGPAGVGAADVVTHAIRRHQLAAASRGDTPASIISGTLDAVADLLDAPDSRAPSSAERSNAPSVARSTSVAGAPSVGGGPTVADHPGRLAAAVVARAVARRGTATVIDASGDERGAALLAAIATARGPGLVIVVAEGREVAAGARAIVLGPVDVATIGALATEMVGRTPPAAWVERLARASRGFPAVAAALIAALAARTGDPFALDPERDAEGSSLDALRLAHVHARGDAALAAAEALAAWEGRADVDLVAATLVEAARAGEARPSGADRDHGADDARPMWAARGVAELIEVGAARRERGVVVMAAGLVEAVREAAGGERMAVWHRAAVEAAKARGSPSVVWAAHLARLPEDADAVEPLCAAATEAMASGRPARALVLAEAAARTAGPAGARAALLGARAALISGRYPTAVALARRAVEDLGDAAAQLVLARAHQRAGEAAAAEQILAALAAERPDDADVIGAYARLLVARGRYDDAVAAVDALTAGQNELPRIDARTTDGARSSGGALRSDAETLATSRGGDRGLPRSAGGALCAEAAGSALLYRGDAAAADARFVEAEGIAIALGDRALLGRARALRGMAAQHRGDLAAASAWYRDAAVDARAGGDLHAAAIADLNHSTTLAERGRHGEALPVLAAATAALAALGHVAELAAAEIDRGLSLLAVGQVEAAEQAAKAAIAASDPERGPQLAVFSRLLAGDVARRRGDPAAARASYDDARAIAARHQLPDERHAMRALAVLDAEHDPGPRGSEQVAPFEPAEALLAALDAGDASTDERDRTLLVRARVALARATGSAALRGAHRGAPDAAPPSIDRAPIASAAPASYRTQAERAAADDRAAVGADRATGVAAMVALGDSVAAMGVRARAEDRRDRAWRAGWLAAALAEAAGLEESALARARAAQAERLALEAETPAVFRDGLASDPDAIALARMVAPVSDERRGERTGSEEMETLRLRRLLALSRRLHAEPSLERLLDEVIDTAIELTRAERGFLLLEKDGALDVVVARGFAAGALADPGAVSRSIAQRAVDGGEPVVTFDAGVDERFGAAASVAAHRLRSVVAVPLHRRGQVGGCLYVDHRLRPSAFDEDATGLLVELADIAALAIENARQADELRRQKAELDVLAKTLGAEVAEREAELAAMRSRLVTRERLGPGFDGIVGTSPEVLAMLDVVQRAARVTSPVVIVGESGTGKELVARALHEAGPRKERPFVAVNCGAMPEHLLESELFGHVRGAFTGAERDRRGLFEVADGGTLFLDEIADTGPAMQAKLLRVLQDGVLRRVGDDRTRHVDVRIVAATQRSLAELAAAGTFRDDLRFRLEVISVRVPPLRSRAADLPLLVEHLLARMAPGRPPALTRAAWRALAAHPWPGNVRELENALARAVALGGEVIDATDLPEAIVARPLATATATPAPGDDLRLRPALDTVERAYIAAALERARGNQTVAARLLGLSRFGLQKKLRRNADDSADADAE